MERNLEVKSISCDQYKECINEMLNFVEHNQMACICSFVQRHTIFSNRDIQKISKKNQFENTEKELKREINLMLEELDEKEINAIWNITMGKFLRRCKND